MTKHVRIWPTNAGEELKRETGERTCLDFCSNSSEDSSVPTNFLNAKLVFLGGGRVLETLVLDNLAPRTNAGAFPTTGAKETRGVRTVVGAPLIAGDTTGGRVVLTGGALSDAAEEGRDNRVGARGRVVFVAVAAAVRDAAAILAARSDGALDTAGTATVEIRGARVEDERRGLEVEEASGRRVGASVVDSGCLVATARLVVAERGTLGLSVETVVEIVEGTISASRGPRKR
jgi:hypothetical protein